MAMEGLLFEIYPNSHYDTTHFDSPKWTVHGLIADRSLCGINATCSEYTMHRMGRNSTSIQAVVHILSKKQPIVRLLCIY